MVQSGDDYREKNRIRLQRFYDKQKRQGKKRVSALVSDEAYRLLTEEKDQAGESMSTLIDQAVLIAYGEHGIPNIVSDEAYTLLVDVKEQTGASMSTLIDQAVTMAYGTQGIPDIDDPALSEEFIASYGDPGQDDTGMEPGAIEVAVNAMGGPVESIEQGQADTQGDDVEDIELEITLVNPDSETDDAAGGDQEPDTAVETEKVTEILPEADTADDLVGQDTDLVDPVTDDTAADDPAPVAGVGDFESDSAADDQDTTQDPDTIPDCTGKVMTIEERDEILVHVAEMLPGRKNVQARLDLLNAKGIPVSLKTGQYGGEWDRKKFTDNLRHAKKRLGVE